MLDKIQIENNINWLLENASYPVRYLTYKNILYDNSAISPDLISKIEESDFVTDIFSKQEKDGSWCSPGLWAAKATMRKSGYTPVSPKYVTTSWILPLLGNSGYNFKDERIRKACEYVLSYQMDNGYIDEIKPGELKKNYDINKNEPCRFSIMLIALGKVGAIEDSRVKKAFDLLIEWQRKDGGWVSENHSTQKEWTRSCPFSSFHSAWALFSSGINNYEKQLKNALEFLIGHLSTKQDSEIQRFFYHGHSFIHELIMFTELKVGLDSRTVDSLLKWLLSMYQPDNSYFKYNGKPITRYTFKDDYMDSKVAKYRLFQLTENDWLTYYATRIFKNLLEK
ncbi:MAG: hypothetical protein GY754_46555 [bacterium]|nr:hypothetical protein [bacterium]